MKTFVRRMQAAILLVCGLVSVSCAGPRSRIVPGDSRTDVYLPLLEGRRIAVFSNHTGMVGDRHLVDLLLENKVDVTAIFSPEHGFRGKADAGAGVGDSTDPDTGVPILSLYGPRGDVRPSADAMSRFDVLVVDIQDVGLRFYTYYITLCHLVDVCGESGKEVIILDRPNPNGHYVDGPLLDMRLKSGVGHLPVPVVHGLTLAELIGMAQGEGWLSEAGNRCRVTPVLCKDYTHGTPCEIPIAPSPNLPNLQAIYLYPSLCPFEGTVVSLGRGTDKPFQQYGHPALEGRYSYHFTPESRPGAQNPPLKGKVCYGVDLSALPDARNIGLDLSYVIDAYSILREKGEEKDFFAPFFDRLMGVTWVREMIEQGCTADEIRQRWMPEVEQFKSLRKKYLLYAE